MSESKVKLELKKKAFEENPERFLDKEDLVIGAIKTKQDGADGYAFFINAACPPLVLGAMVHKLTRQVNMFLDQVEFAAEKADKGIIVPGVTGGNGKGRIGRL